MLERAKGIEPSYSAWKAAALPLSYTRALAPRPARTSKPGLRSSGPRKSRQLGVRIGDLPKGPPRQPLLQDVEESLIEPGVVRRLHDPEANVDISVARFYAALARGIEVD